VSSTSCEAGRMGVQKQERCRIGFFANREIDEGMIVDIDPKKRTTKCSMLKWLEQEE